MCLTQICFIIPVYDDFSNMAYEQNGRRKLQQYCQNEHFFSDVHWHCYIISGHNFRKYVNGLQHKQDRFMLCIKQYRLKVFHILNGNIAIAMKVPHLRCLVEFQGVTEQNVSHSPKYLMNQMENYDECMRI